MGSMTHKDWFGFVVGASISFPPELLDWAFLFEIVVERT